MPLSDRSKSSNYHWYHCNFYVPQLFQCFGKILLSLFVVVVVLTFSGESVRQQVLSGLQNSSKYHGWLK